ncbi:hypothetical protein VNI00_017738 [Paramarasmius palmivorus]|uniref:Uncharacterized protein n=1 Tax=Paramarasmius palmivorus TaxID=297713 RepID=A0AAW0B408_9AGAR
MLALHPAGVVIPFVDTKECLHRLDVVRRHRSRPKLEAPGILAPLPIGNGIPPLVGMTMKKWRTSQELAIPVDGAAVLSVRGTLTPLRFEYPHYQNARTVRRRYWDSTIEQMFSPWGPRTVTTTSIRKSNFLKVYLGQRHCFRMVRGYSSPEKRMFLEYSYPPPLGLIPPSS